jgi:hypothetical protein
VSNQNVIKIYGLCLLVISFACETGQASGQELPRFTRTITGVVVDKENQPVADARVCAWGTGPIAGRVPCAESNRGGQFAIDVYRPDTYKISAENLAQGYPEAIWGFYGKLFSAFPVVTIDDSISVTPVEVKLGPKAGRVIFTILDGETSKRIEAGSITACRVGEPLLCWSKSTAFPDGRYELLTPEVPFTVKFETSVANTWVNRAAFDKSGVPIEVLSVNLGARMEVTVRLQ